ncbi:MAG: family 78 glycoside hydrolase catalytic domain, partial [Devosia sp.]
MSGLSALDLRVEHLAEPRGLKTATPRFSWALASERMGAHQTAWRIRVFEVTRGGETLLWDSGRVASPQSQHVPYAGPPLPRDAVLTWQLSVWDETGALSDARPPAPIFTGLRQEDWSGQWIARYFVLPAGREVPADTIYDNRWQARPADYVRRSFALAERPVRALLYISALGLYEPWLNGQRVGADVLAPGWTDYHTRVEYQVHDVSDHVVAGENVIGAILGEGWYSGRVGHNQRRAGNHYGGRPALICALHLHHADGRVEIIASDDQWQTRQGPICYSDFLMGEMYDARLALDGWSERQGLEGWQPVECFVPDPRPPLLEAARAQPVREIACLEARFLRFSASGAALFDLGQNIAGYCALSVSAPAGARFVLRHGEILDDAGELYVANLRHAVATDVFIAAGQGEERFCPHFTFHGFRYVELTLSDGLTPEDVQLSGVAISTATPQTGTLSFGHEMLDRLVSNINWSQRDNFIAVPTDCPQRDERYGWTADAQVFWKTAGYFADCSAFLAKWMLDIADGQSAEGAFPDVAPTKPLNPYRLTPQPGAPGWGDAPIILAWEHWLRHADRELVEAYYPAFERWMAHIGAPNPDFLRRNAVYNNYGDWLSV